MEGWLAYVYGGPVWGIHCIPWEGVLGVRVLWILCVERTYAEAAFRPRPREPPVTTATLPLREKSEGKSLSCVSSAIVSISEGTNPSQLTSVELRWTKIE